MSAQKSFLTVLLELFASLFGSKPPAPPAPPPPPSETGELVPLAPRVLVIIYNPILDPATHRKMTQVMAWNDPDQLAAGYIADVEECTNGLVKYQIVERVEVNEFAPKVGGTNYDAPGYITTYRNGGPWNDNPGDYGAIIARFDVQNRVTQNELDEVWVFNYPGASFYESTMAGRGAFWCNSEPRSGTDACPRKFIIMGFSPERGIGEMHENLGHRAESILAHLFQSEDFLGWTYNRERNPKTTASVRNDFERFILFEQVAPGNANLGTVHYAPNSTQDYEWDRDAPVACCADDWFQYPNLPNPPNYKTLNTADWGGGEIRAHHKWWFKHFPKAAGVTNSVANNWWKYIIDPNNVGRSPVVGASARITHG